MMGMQLSKGTENADFLMEGDVLIKYNGGEKNVIVPDEVREIGANAFADCSSLSDISFPKTVKRIGSTCFSNCKGLNEVTLPEGLEVLGASAFYGCSSLRSVHLPSGLKEIGSNAFADCCNLTGISVPETVKTIGWACFFECRRLAGVTLPEGLEVLEGSTFYGCGSLHSIRLPSGLKEIGSDAFAGCSSLSEISIPETVKKIGSDAFANCSSLQIVTVSESAWELNWLGDEKFLVFAPHINPWKSSQPLSPSVKRRLTCGFAVALSEGMSIPEERRAGYLTYIRSQRKRLYPKAIECPALLKLMLSEKIVPLRDLEELKGMVSGKKNTELAAALLAYQEDCFPHEDLMDVFRKEMKMAEQIALTGFYPVEEVRRSWRYKEKEDGTLMILSYKGKEQSVPVPAGIGKRKVTEIGEGAFAGNDRISRVTLPEEITEIGLRAFAGCIGLEEIEMPGVRKICSGAFKNCRNLKNVRFPETLPKMCRSVWENCMLLADPMGLIVFGELLCGYVGTVSEVIVPEGVREALPGTFKFREELTSVILPEGFRKVSREMFSGCKNLTKAVIPESTEEIGEDAFRRCFLLRKVYIRGSHTKVHPGAFKSCFALTEYREGFWAEDEAALAGAADEGILPAEGGKEIRPEDISFLTGAAAVITKTGESVKVVSVGERCRINVETGSGEIKTFVFYSGAGRRYITDYLTFAPDETLRRLEGAIRSDREYRERTSDSRVEQVMSVRPEYDRHRGFKTSGGKLIKYYGLERDVRIPDDITEISGYAFLGRDLIESVYIPDAVTKLSQYTLSNCTKLKKVRLSPKTTVIGKHVLENCTGLREIELPDTLRWVGDGFLANCTGIRCLTLPESITRLRGFAKAPYALFAPHIIPERSKEKVTCSRLCVGFAIALAEGRYVPDESMDEYLAFISKAYDLLFPDALKYPELLDLMLSRKLIPGEKADQLAKEAEKEGIRCKK